VTFLFTDIEGSTKLAQQYPSAPQNSSARQEALREKNQSPMADYERVEYDQAVTQLHSMLTEMEFNALWAKGRSLTIEQAIELALEENK